MRWGCPAPVRNQTRYNHDVCRYWHRLLSKYAALQRFNVTVCVVPLLPPPPPPPPLAPRRRIDEPANAYHAASPRCSDDRGAGHHECARGSNVHTVRVRLKTRAASLTLAHHLFVHCRPAVRAPPRFQLPPCPFRDPPSRNLHQQTPPHGFTAAFGLPPEAALRLVLHTQQACTRLVHAATDDAKLVKPLAPQSLPAGVRTAASVGWPPTSNGRSPLAHVRRHLLAAG